MTPLLLIVLFITSVYGRVAVIDQDASSSNLNTIYDSKIVKSLLEDIGGGIVPIPDVVRTCHENEVDNDLDDNEPCEDSLKVDNGTALLLTPLIEQGRIAEAVNASRVDPALFLGVESYSGFLTVNNTHKSHLFFWYFPSFAKPVNETPWIIWLQGGPGASSLTGLFDEIGPFGVSHGTLKFNPHTWLMNHSLVFIDNPVGTGFSFTEHKDGYAKDMATYGAQLHSCVRQLVQLFPELRVAPLFVAGESYAGKYVPALGREIHRHKDAPGADLNLKGLIIGNAYVEPGMISEVVRPFYQFGLLEKEQVEVAQPLIDAFQADIAANRSKEAKEKWTYLISVLLGLSHLNQAYNFLRDDLPVGRYVSFLEKPEVKRALHVGDIKFSFVNFTVNMELAPDFLSNAKPLYEELLEDYKVLAYCGQLDQMLPCALAGEHYRAWRWNSSAQFLEADRHAYFYNHKLAGYQKTGGGLTWMVVRGAGHMVPMDAPAATRNMITSFTSGQPLSLHSTHTSLLRDVVKNITAIAPSATYL